MRCPGYHCDIIRQTRGGLEGVGSMERVFKTNYLFHLQSVQKLLLLWGQVWKICEKLKGRINKIYYLPPHKVPWTPKIQAIVKGCRLLKRKKLKGQTYP